VYLRISATEINTFINTDLKMDKKTAIKIPVFEMLEKVNR
jgi:hypothetical protein